MEKTVKVVVIYGTPDYLRNAYCPALNWFYGSFRDDFTDEEIIEASKEMIMLSIKQGKAPSVFPSYTDEEAIAITRKEFHSNESEMKVDKILNITLEA